MSHPSRIALAVSAFGVLFAVAAELTSRAMCRFLDNRKAPQ